MSDWKQPQDRKEFLGHPVGLFVLFFTELWERFSFYGMRALLVLYMTKQLLFTDEMSYGIYGAYGSLVYATPITARWSTPRRSSVGCWPTGFWASSGRSSSARY